MSLSAAPEIAGSKAARRLLKLLVDEQARIAPIEDGERFGVFVKSADSPRLKVSRSLIDGLIAHELIVQVAGGLCVYEASAPAAALHRRLGASDDPMRAQHWPDARRAKPRNARTPAAVGDSPLDWLRHRRGAGGDALISQAEFDAGERLREDFTRAQMTPRVTGDLTSPCVGAGRRGPSEGLTVSEAAIAAKQRYQAALDAVGPQLSGVLVCVCCHLNGLEEAEHAFGWPRRSGKVVLQLALERLAEHYGFVRCERARAFRAWRDPESKPLMFASAEAG
ncbi:MAG: DUF6456 domain-containing protein [Pseudomonadota bacterium]